jgi:hypothetical protein
MSDDHADVEIFVRKRGSDDGVTWKFVYDDVARMHTRTLIQQVTVDDADAGRYVIGLREQGDEVHTRNIELTPLESHPGDTEHVFRTYAAALIEHWRF